MEYIKFTLDFPELAFVEDKWRDGEAVWSLSQGHPWKGFWLRDGQVTICLSFLLSPGNERRGDVVLRVSEWRQFPELILAGIHDEWRRAGVRTREEMLRKRQEAASETIRVEQERREAVEREREIVAALLEGRPRQVESPPEVVAVEQEETAEVASLPAVVATESRQPQNQTRIQDLEGLGREL